jgi:hypothetical protein
MTDMADLYDACLGEVERLAAALTAEQWATPVPATPAWCVRQVVAHLAGSASDAATGRMDEAPGEGWTARHVAELEDRAPADLATSLRSTQAAVAASTEDNPRPAIVWNISVHLADVHEALGPTRLDAALWEPVLAAVAPYRLAEAPARVRCGHEVWGSGDAEVAVAPYELFRMLFSRRSRRQMQAWGTPPFTPDRLDALPVFGPRDDDQPVPS